ncbi:GAF domain-containing protein [Phormidesmis sp. 146-35]
MIDLDTIFTVGSDPNAVFTALMPALCEALECDRCFLYLRNPATSQGTVTHCYSRHSPFADLTGSTFIEAEAVEDPLMGMAFRTPEAVFVDDIETAGSDVVNVVYEREAFGHRALIHAPLYYKGELYGILEPCVFGQPRKWSEHDRALIHLVQQRSATFVVQYLR